VWLLVEGARVLRWVGVNHRRVQNLAQFEKDDPDAGWDSIIESWRKAFAPGIRTRNGPTGPVTTTCRPKPSRKENPLNGYLQHIIRI